MSVPYGLVPSNAEVQPSKFNLAVSEGELNDFKALLKLSKVGPVTYENVQQDRRYGITREWLKNAKEHWETTFDWRAHERKINSFPNFTMPVDDGDGSEYTVHFTALFSEKKDAIPIVFLHGWPGSFLEFLPMLSLFREQYSPADLPYHLIVPSLPGYTLSPGPPTTTNLTCEHVARIMDRLMLNLGFGSGYIAQGGDVGCFISVMLAGNHEACKAIHVNMLMITPPSDFDPASVTDPLEQQGLASGQKFFQSGMAYALEHGTRPSTVGLALSASPLALLAWIGEKFLDWTDKDPPLDAILESITLYWFTESFPRSIYPYRELSTIAASMKYIEKPLGFSWFPKDIGSMPKSLIEKAGNLVFFRQHKQGGHFAALEEPAVLKKDIEDYVAALNWPVGK